MSAGAPAASPDGRVDLGPLGIGLMSSPTEVARAAEAMLRERGSEVVDLGTIVQVAFREKMSRNWADRPDVVLAPGGSNVTQVYLRAADGSWGKEPAGPDATKALAEVFERRPAYYPTARAVLEVPLTSSR